MKDWSEVTIEDLEEIRDCLKSSTISWAIDERVSLYKLLFGKKYKKLPKIDHDTKFVLHKKFKPTIEFLYKDTPNWIVFDENEIFPEDYYLYQDSLVKWGLPQIALEDKNDQLITWSSLAGIYKRGLVDVP